MAASPWNIIFLALCLVVLVSVSSGAIVPEDGMHHNRVARQIPPELQERAEAAKQSFHDVASAGAQRAEDLAASAHTHLSKRVKQAEGWVHGAQGGSAGGSMDAASPI